jgi:hypothetical protein
VAKKPSRARTGQRALGGFLTSSAAEKEIRCPRAPASRPLALVARGELGAGPKLALLLLRCVWPQGSILDRARRRASGSFSEYPFCYESHAPTYGGTATRSHGVAPALECRLRLKRLPPKAVPWVPPFKSSTPERLSGLLPFRLFSRRGKRKLVLPFWKEKLRSGSSFSFQNGNPKDSSREGDDQGERSPIPRVRDDARLIKKQH